MSLTTGVKVIVDETPEEIIRKVVEFRREINRAVRTSCGFKKRERRIVMDLATVLGLAIALIGILVGQAIEGGSILQILQPTAAMIVCGGTLGATMIGFPLSVMKQAAADFSTLLRTRISVPMK
jgi:hypothetical protein